MLKPVFYSENRPIGMKLGLGSLANVAKATKKVAEELNYPQEVEWATLNDQVYLLQSRPITDLQDVETFELSDVPEEKLLWRSKLCRGIGKVTLPAVVTDSVMNAFNGVAMKYLEEFSLEHASLAKKMYFKELQECDKQFPDGYILVTPTFNATYARQEWFEECMQDVHSLTPNKKAVVTLEQISRSSYIMNVAREKGILYVGADYRDTNCYVDGCFQCEIETGDMITVEVNGREGIVYRGNPRRT